MNVLLLFSIIFKPEWLTKFSASNHEYVYFYEKEDISKIETFD